MTRYINNFLTTFYFHLARYKVFRQIYGLKLSCGKFPNKLILLKNAIIRLVTKTHKIIV